MNGPPISLSTSVRQSVRMKLLENSWIQFHDIDTGWFYEKLYSNFNFQLDRTPSIPTLLADLSTSRQF
jgi:hypothetical protein